MQQRLPPSREEFRGFLDRHIVVTAEYVRTAPRHSERGAVEFSLLLRDVQLAESGKYLTDHAWVPLAPSWQRQRLASGDYLQFAGVVRAYRKGYQGTTDRNARSASPFMDFYIEPTSAPQRLARG